MLQLYVPGIRNWLDIKQLDDVDILDKSDADYELFTLFYSVSYFKSYNYRGKVSSAVVQGKRNSVFHQVDKSSIKNNIEVECATDFQYKES